MTTMRELMKIVEGARRSTLDEDAAMMTPSALAHWFHGSKVVDAQGRPKRMYHGTGAGNIDAFAFDKANAEALYGPGFYFTDSPNVAGGTGGGETEDDINMKADWQLAGYAFQGRKYAIHAPLTKKQLTYAKRLFGTKMVQYDARQDIGTRENYRKGWQALEAGDEPAFREWLTTSAPRWMRDKLKAERERTTTPTVYPVFLRIVNPYEMDQIVDLSLFRKLWDASPGERKESFEEATKDVRENLHWLEQAAKSPQLIYRGTPPTGAEAWEWLIRRVVGSKTEANNVLMKLGYDGIHHQGGRIVSTMGEHDVWIAFHPEQVKSIFARQYNPSSPNIGEGAR